MTDDLLARSLTTGGITEAYDYIEDLRAEVTRLRAELEEARLRVIEATNPGIDMDEVRRTRAVSPTPRTPDD